MAARLMKAPNYFPPLGRKQLLVLIVCCITAVLTMVSLYLSRRPPQLDVIAVRAAHDMRDGMKIIAGLRHRLGIPIEFDPAQTGLIGKELSDLTTTLGDLSAKQTSVNPAFASLIVGWLQQASVKPGDRVAISLTGSFPALNLAAMTACKALDLTPVIISSVGASSYGANIPGFTWLDMEKELYDRGFIPWRTQLVSLGGIVDTQGGLDGSGFALGEAAIARHGAKYLPEGDQRNVEQDIARRWDIYTASGMPKAYINVGGGVTALGWVQQAALLQNGLLTRVPSSDNPRRGLIFRMFEAGVPVIHLINIEHLAATHHLPIAPSRIDDDTDLSSAWRKHVATLLVVLLAWLGLGSTLAWRARNGHPGR